MGSSVQKPKKNLSLVSQESSIEPARITADSLIDSQVVTGDEAAFAKSIIDKGVNFLFQTNLRYAVIGPSGCGKTEFTYQFLGLEVDEDNDMPGSGPGIESRTKHRKTITHPDYPNIKVDDIPGIGFGEYLGVSVDEYWKKLDLDEYDAYVLMGNQWFRKQEIDLYEKIRHHGKRVVLVISHFDVFEDNLFRKKRWDRSKASELQPEIKAEARKYAETFIPLEYNVPLYFVDTREVNKYDFPDLFAALLELPNEIQRLIASSAFFHPSPKMIEKQAQGMRDMARLVAIASAASGAIPIPGLDMVIDAGIIAMMFEKYKKNFKLTLEAIKQLCRLFSIAEGEAEGIMSRLEHGQLLTAGSIKESLRTKNGILRVIKLLALSSLTLALASSDDVVKGVPVVGSILGSAIGAPIGYFTTLHILKGLINMLERDAKKVLLELERLDNRN